MKIPAIGRIGESKQQVSASRSLIEPIRFKQLDQVRQYGLIFRGELFHERSLGKDRLAGFDRAGFLNLPASALAELVCHRRCDTYLGGGPDNHPSGLPEPSRADEMLTVSLKQALSLIDVKVLDHFIVANSATLSFAERGLL